jgi:hypothetical protein
MSIGGRESRFVEAVLAQVTAIRPSVDAFRDESIRASLFEGAAGVAFFLHEAARLKNPALMDLAERWIRAAEDWAHDARDADWTNGGEPAYCGHLLGLGGVGYTRVVISTAMGDAAGVARGLEALARACARVRDQEWLPTTLFDGAGGLLCALAQVRRVSTGDLARDAVRIGEPVWAFLAEHSSRRLADTRQRLGMAHGVAGEVWSAVTWSPAGQPLPDVVRARIAELVDVAEQDDEMIVWPQQPGVPFGELAHSYCNGLTGHAHLWSTLAAQRVDGADHVARRLAQTMCALGSAGLASLCCGLAGQALLHRRLSGLAPPLARHDARARVRLSRAVDGWDGALDQPKALGLWQGALGVALIVMLQEAAESQVPCLELPGTFA